MNSPKISAVTQSIAERDSADALRLIEAATFVAGMAGLASPQARELAGRRLRELACLHPRSAEVFASVVAHLESYS